MSENPAMTTMIDGLTATLAGALGLSRRQVDETAGHQREAGMLAEADAPATAEHCSALLFGVMRAPDPERSPEMVRLYCELPLERVTRSEVFANGQVEFLDVPGDDPLVDDCRMLGDSLGEFLTHLIRCYAFADEMNIRPGRIVLCGGLGNAAAMIELSAEVDGSDIGGTVHFSMVGGGCRPDDAPRARLDQNPSVPAEIFQVFREFLAGEPEGPREVALVHDGAGGDWQAGGRGR